MRTKISPFVLQGSSHTEEVEVELAGAEAASIRFRTEEEAVNAEEPQGEVPLEEEVLEEARTNEHLRVGGRLLQFKDRWSFSPWAQSIVSKGLGWSWKGKGPPPLRKFFQKPTQLLLTYVRDLLSKSVVKKIKSIKFQGRLFCVPKRDTLRKRVILDLSLLNKAIVCDRFQMLTIAQVRTLLPRGVVTCSIDLTDAYWHIPIAHHLIPYLGFRLGKQAYAFRAMPFGLNIAPRIFTKLTDSIIQVLRSWQILVAAYLDDWIVWAPTAAECLQSVRKVIAFLQHLGFQINKTKSRLSPAAKFEWLGLTWDLQSHTLSLPQIKRKSIAKLTRQFLKSPLVSRRAQERVLGSLQFASVTDCLLKAKLKDINRVWRSRARTKLRDRRSCIPSILRKRLRPWS